MASTLSKLFNVFLRLIRKKSFLSKQLDAGSFNFYTRSEPHSGISRTCRVNKIKINSRNVFTLSPRNKNRNSGKHILYLHGGAYVQGFVRPHWYFLSGLIKRTGCVITAPDYPLAPDHTYKDAFAMVETLYRELILTVSPDDLIIMGDSSGGGFALALAQKMKYESVKQPGQIILLCPWLDINLTNPAISSIDRMDPFLSMESLKKAGKLYAGTTPTDFYLLSPINGPLEELGKISIFIGSKDILVADARKLKCMVQSKGIHINYYEYANMVHAWMFLNFPESKKAREQIIQLILQS